MEKIKETNPEKLKEWHHNAYLNRKQNYKKHLMFRISKYSLYSFY